MVKPATIAIKEQAVAPARAAALPPPGTGSEEASVDINLFTVNSPSIVVSFWM
jgi:hypothetical protein